MYSMPALILPAGVPVRVRVASVELEPPTLPELPLELAALVELELTFAGAVLVLEVLAELELVAAPVLATAAAGFTLAPDPSDPQADKTTQHTATGTPYPR